ncbi:MAG: hypothetical protein WC727_06635 [Ignavibacteriaceae bacterium]
MFEIQNLLAKVYGHDCKNIEGRVLHFEIWKQRDQHNMEVWRWRPTQ